MPPNRPMTAYARAHADRATRPLASVARGKARSRHGPGVPTPADLRSEIWCEESRTSAVRTPRGANRFSRFSGPRSLLAPDALQMVDAPFQILDRHARIHLEHFDVPGLH